jgi:hypothetical protein
MAIPIPAELAAALANGGAMVGARVEGWLGSTKVADLDVDGGSIDLDRGAATRRSMTLTLPGLTAIHPTAAWVATLHSTGAITLAERDSILGGASAAPALLAALVAPGTELRAYWTWEAAGASGEVAAGRYRIASRNVSDDASGVTVDVQAFDISRTISRRPWPGRYTLKKGTNFVSGTTAVARNRWPGVTVISTPTTHTTARVVLGGRAGLSDPWTDIVAMMEAIGYEAYFDANGCLNLVPVSDPTTLAATARLVDGVGGTVVSLTEGLSDDRLVNGIILENTNASTKKSIRVKVWDDSVLSPTRRALVGEMPLVIKTRKNDSVAAARAAARAHLRRKAGFTSAVEVQTWPRPDVEAGDVVVIESSAAGVSGTFMVERVSLPLSVTDLMTITCSRRVT